jgi:cell division protein FtsL
MAITNQIVQKTFKPQRMGFRWLLLIGIIFCELLTYTWVRTESTQTIFRISKQKGDLTQKVSYNKALTLERDRLRSDDRITKIAKTRLNLSTDTPKQIIYISGENG